VASVRSAWSFNQRRTLYNPDPEADDYDHARPPGEILGDDGMRDSTVTISRTYHFDFDHPVDKLWAVVSDTPRWGEASGFPKYQVSEQLQEDGRVLVFGTIDIAGMTIRWEEPPGNWIAERWFEQQRNFITGPMISMTTIASLEDRAANSALDLELKFETRNLIGSFLAKRLLAGFEDKVRALLVNADQLIRAEKPELFVSNYEPDKSSQDRALKLIQEIDASPYGHGLANRLIEHINRSQEVDLWAMRPIAIARHWGASTRDAIELFLQSVRGGILESRWDVLCPRCRISKSTTSNLDELPRGVHCDSCNIDFESDFSSNVELSFSPSPSIRPVENGYYCRSGPGVTPHIKGQCSLPPGASRSLPLSLHPGNYRVRTLEAGDEAQLNWERGPFPEIHVDDSAVKIAADSPPGEIRMVNDGQFHRTVVIEDQSWLRDVLTAERATTLQAFRDLFSDQVLRPGDEVSIRNIVFAFTDLVGSSSLFSRRGDAEAYRVVREHFSDLSEIVRRNLGNIVKTAGDGIHAAFLTPDDALRASIEMQQSMPAFNQRFDCGDISMRIGLHHGSSISVTLNGRLDYYGEAVNLAARLEGLGSGGDITMSKTFASDPGVSAMLLDYDLREREENLKGFIAPVRIVQFRP
jgi:class 3 adenylate cyclase